MKKIEMLGRIDDNSVALDEGGASIVIDPDWVKTNADSDFFVRIQSYDSDLYTHPLYSRDKEENIKLSHKTIRQLFGKKIKLTIEVMDD